MTIVTQKLFLFPLTAYSLVVLAALACNAQMNPHFDEGSRKLVNPYDFPAEMLLLHSSADRNIDYRQAVRVEAHGSIPVSAPVNTQVVRIIPLDLKIPIRSAGSCPNGATAIRLTPALVREQLAIGDKARDEGRAFDEGTADKIYAVKAQGTLDTVNAILSDPVEEVGVQHAERDGAYGYAAQMEQTELTQAALVGIVSLGFSNGAISVHSAAAGQEKEDLDNLLVEDGTVLEKLARAYSNTADLLVTEREFNAHAAQELSSAYPASLVVPSHPEFGRLCSGAANNTDQLVLKMDVPQKLNAVLGRSHFDHGGDEDLIFRRIAGTSQWTATIYWSVESARATVQVHGSKGWNKVGDVQAGRPSLQQQLSDARKTIGTLKKRRRSAAYAADGGDESKTVILP